jgi:hypothetical protein
MSHAAEWVYVLCALASLACAVLLARGYFKSRARILLWSTLSFALLALNNVLLFIDLVVLPNTVDLSPLRDLSALLAMAVLVFGLLWDAD